jgi:RecA/RadA recombinase
MATKKTTQKQAATSEDLRADALNGFLASMAKDRPGEVRALSDESALNVEVIPTGVISLDVALGTFVAALKAAQAAGSSTASVVYGPGGSVAGQIRQNAEVYVSSYDVSSGVGGRVEYSASLQVTGAVLNGTW